ncbi:unnamed protein product [Tenebrio molitor]|nr:unnamed protein product [Tenebrio molitor]
MFYYPTLMFLGLATLKNVVSLNCYTTNLASVEEGDLKNLKHNLEDCTHYMSEMSKLRGHSVDISSLSHIETHCFTVSIHANATDVKIKGCTPKGGCVLMKEVFKSIVHKSHNKTLGVLKHIKCDECGEDRCNSAPRSTVASLTVFLLVFTSFM